MWPSQLLLAGMTGWTMDAEASETGEMDLEEEEADSEGAEDAAGAEAGTGMTETDSKNSHHFISTA